MVAERRVYKNIMFNNKSNYKFSEPKETACFTCNHILNGERPILYVSHDKDDSSWQFLCGHSDHTDENIRLIGLGQAVEIDSSINDLFEMPEGVCAERNSIKEKWVPFKTIE